MKTNDENNSSLIVVFAIDFNVKFFGRCSEKKK